MRPPTQILGSTTMVTIDATIIRNVTAYLNDPAGCAPAPPPSWRLVPIKPNTRFERGHGDFLFVPGPWQQKPCLAA